ncbi:MlaD family protein [Mycobacterium sp. CVI_P3]|uniref:MlaD family protein n=1 Tax=Mycobacterium pinniadriaticum TaxID=2994102 RepID=A0ABT3SNT6_9MYCO|nr:MlaD family protein [Mycobacterium pinniadriaticum]MCX2934754.1 MlaD family protein [Mycobacterium pinniadriaticum]MCX2941176.1 MlaD family protein [Mycobacterium pinniadriaticum]
MRLQRRIKIQLGLFTIIAIIAAAVMVVGYMRLPAVLFGAGRYTVTVKLHDSGGLYKRGNVTYRGTEVGRIEAVRLTDSGAEAKLSLDRDINIPSDLDAEVHSQSAIGELYIALLPRNGTSPPLKDGDVIPANRTSVPPDINSLIDATNRGLASIPQDNLKTAIDESYTAVGGLGQELSRIVQGSTQLAIDARANLDPLVSLIDQSAPVLDSQRDSADTIRAWAAHLSAITGQLQTHDASFAGLLHKGPQAAEEARELFERLQPTLPLLLANLVTVGEVAVTYQPAIEQLLVLLPQGTANEQGTILANRDTQLPFKGMYLDFNLNMNLPPPCTTGFLPIQQQRVPTFEDSPDRPAEDIYCRIPQDNPLVAVRGARNYPCMTVPGKRAPTVKMCESNEQYVPLNDGQNWKGDPNATLSGQDIPQPSPGPAPVPGRSQHADSAPAPLPIAAAEYNPANGSYVGPDGQVYRQLDLAPEGSKQTWQTMLTPAGN